MAEGLARHRLGNGDLDLALDQAGGQPLTRLADRALRARRDLADAPRRTGRHPPLALRMPARARGPSATGHLVVWLLLVLRASFLTPHPLTDHESELYPRVTPLLRNVPNSRVARRVRCAHYGACSLRSQEVDVTVEGGGSAADKAMAAEVMRLYRRVESERHRGGVKRTRVVAVRFTDAEHAELERAALDDNCRQLGAWIRDVPVRLMLDLRRKQRGAERADRGDSSGRSLAPAESASGSTAGALSVEQWQLVHDLRVELSKVGNNMNQVARSLNGEAKPMDERRYERALEVSNEQLAATRAEVARLYELLARLEER